MTSVGLPRTRYKHWFMTSRSPSPLLSCYSNRPTPPLRITCPLYPSLTPSLSYLWHGAFPAVPRTVPERPRGQTHFLAWSSRVWNGPSARPTLHYVRFQPARQRHQHPAGGESYGRWGGGGRKGDGSGGEGRKEGEEGGKEGGGKESRQRGREGRGGKVGGMRTGGRRGRGAVARGRWNQRAVIISFSGFPLAGPAGPLPPALPPSLSPPSFSVLSSKH